MLDMPNWQEITALLGGVALLGTFFVFVTDSLIRKRLEALDEIYMRKDVALGEFKRINDHFEWIQGVRKVPPRE